MQTTFAKKPNNRMPTNAEDAVMYSQSEKFKPPQTSYVQILQERLQKRIISNIQFLGSQLREPK